MNTNSTPHISGTPLGIKHLVAVFALLSAPLLAKGIWNQRSLERATAKFNEDRHLIISNVHQAIENQDLAKLRRIAAKFGPAVQDEEFHDLLGKALSDVTSKEARAELAASKKFDLDRLREESSIALHSSDLSNSEIRPVQREKLSTLPR